MSKKLITNSQPFVKNEKMSGPLGAGDFFDSHCTYDTFAILSDNGRAVRVRYFAVR